MENLNFLKTRRARAKGALIWVEYFFLFKQHRRSQGRELNRFFMINGFICLLSTQKLTPQQREQAKQAQKRQKVN